MSVIHHQSDWTQLLRIACALIRQVNSEQLIIDDWTLGGGTAMMLQIDHRDSYDVDIFLPDPQLLPFLDPKTHDFSFETAPTDYRGDGTGFLKLVFENVGEIDFIVRQTMTALPTQAALINGENILLETIPEIITKKIYHRGSMIMPRDIFDIAAAAEKHAQAVINELRNFRGAVVRTLDTIEKMNPDFVNTAIAQMAIRDKYTSIADTAIERTRELLRAV